HGHPLPRMPPQPRSSSFTTPAIMSLPLRPFSMPGRVGRVCRTRSRLVGKEQSVFICREVRAREPSTGTISISLVRSSSERSRTDLFVIVAVRLFAPRSSLWRFSVTVIPSENLSFPSLSSQARTLKFFPRCHPDRGLESEQRDLLFQEPRARSNREFH